MVPVASCVRVWSMRRPISPPATISPETRWAAMIFCVTFMDIVFFLAFVCFADGFTRSVLAGTHMPNRARVPT
ncbi:hypothetical protein DSM101010T_01170 [Desulfovibrio subterraneus]|uniref:Uncharacterized protein n=1 Tax=Desulfovibrio subterraneus TaxID=2718620 RepID=A0A7J0BEY9_9BACT|nr:hypothetical protein DSM101010T_01170 [Desulfovibrio subterraneus]